MTCHACSRVSRPHPLALIGSSFASAAQKIKSAETTASSHHVPCVPNGVLTPIPPHQMRAPFRVIRQPHASLDDISALHSTWHHPLITCTLSLLEVQYTTYPSNEKMESTKFTKDAPTVPERHHSTHIQSAQDRYRSPCLHNEHSAAPGRISPTSKKKGHARHPNGHALTTSTIAHHTLPHPTHPPKSPPPDSAIITTQQPSPICLALCGSRPPPSCDPDPFRRHSSSASQP